ncbi:hypothetical protein NLG97_g5115 [Lecanicillium saksenae]|uniref:Uncharacterized protein n=1 Tax=Lecanicillium saksenae TaxID=468837 RepID=A0ACC1QV87_9HYPO|nr:hypothetical protein NLG97_g5115 [Lecanicillium saksenae]
MADAGDDFTLVERGMVPAVAIETGEALQLKRQKVLSWLDPTDYLSPGNEYMKHLHAYLPGTAKWVHESPIFRSWRSQDTSGDAGADTDSGYHRLAPASAHGASCLHVRGVAGSGKSVFSASTIDQLQSVGNIVLFFFFRQIVEKNHTTKYLARDFAAQLLPHSDALVGQLADLSQSHSVDGLGTDALWSVIFKTLVEGGADRPVFCVVDALDEMDDADFPDMMEKLTTLGSANPEAVKVMFTGRPLPKIEQALQGKAIFQLKLDPVLLSPDVSRYVDARMASLESRLSDDKCELVRQAICERASGLFLHARLVTDNLAQGLQEGRITEETLPNSLDRLPRSLREVYEEMLKEHAHRSGVSADHQAKILTCVTHSSRPMRLIELASLVAQMLAVDLRRGKEIVRASCGRLLELLEDETVSVIHHSFTEFLHDETRSEIIDAFPVLEDSQAHDMLAGLCLEYLNTCPHFDMTIDERRDPKYEDYIYDKAETARRTENRTQVRLSHPLAAYAIENLPFHFQKSSITANSYGLTVLDTCFLPGKPAFETWALFKWEHTLTSSINALHQLIDGNIPLTVIQHIANASPLLIDSPDSMGRTPLMHAARLGRADIVDLLLSKGINPDTACKHGFTALHHAVAAGKADAVKQFLEAGIDPLIKTAPVYASWDFIDRYMIHYTEEEAQENRKTALSKAILGHFSDVAIQFVPFIPAEEVLNYFHRAESPEVIDSILTAGLVDVDSLEPRSTDELYYYDHLGKTRLFASAVHGELEIIKVLLKHGADPTKRELGEPTVLHAIAGQPKRSRQVYGDPWWRIRQEEITDAVKLLVDAGADINATMTHPNRKSSTGYTALHMAVQRKGRELSASVSEAIIEALLEAGADPNSSTSCGNTPIHLARVGRLKAFEILRRYGAKIDGKNAAGQTPFLSISSQRIDGTATSQLYKQSDEVITALTRLLDLGADPAAIDHDGNNFFHYLMQNISFIGSDYCIPLVERVLKAADPNLKNKQGYPPIFLYRPSNLVPRYQSHEPVNSDKLLGYLVQNGMQLNVQNRAGEPLSHFLLTCDLPDTADFKRLIDLGADPNVVDARGKSLFHKAILSDSCVKVDWLKYVMKLVTVPFSTDEEGNTIIHDIVKKDFDGSISSVLELIIEAGADPLAKNHKGQSALHVADSINAKDVVKSPYFQSLNLNEADIDGLTPLHYFVECNENFYADLLKRGGNPFIRSSTGMLPLHFAAQAGDPGLVDFLLAQYGSVDGLLKDINSLGGGLSPLHYACRIGLATTVSVLLRRGADPNLVDSDGLTPLHRLSEFVAGTSKYEHAQFEIRTPDIVHMLHRYGADLDTTANVPNAVTGSIHATPLDLAVSSKRWEVVRELLACGARGRAQHETSPEFLLATDKDKALARTRTLKENFEAGAYPVKGGRSRKYTYHDRRERARWACLDSPPEKVDWWILGAQTFHDLPKERDKFLFKHDVFITAVKELDFDTIKDYQAAGGDMQAVMCHGLPWSIQHQYEYMLRHFSDQVRQYPKTISRGSSAGTRQVSYSLLGVACTNKRPSMSIVEWLVDEIGVDINAPHEYRMESPLHIAARGKSFWHVEALKYLLAKGADLEARTDMGMTPLLSALSEIRGPGKWKTDKVRLLLEHGADPNARAELQPDIVEQLLDLSYAISVSALDLAEEPEILSLLIAYGVEKSSSVNVLARIVRMSMLPEATTVLLDAGWDPNEEPSNKDAHRELADYYREKDCEGRHSEFNRRYALHEAARPPAMHDPPDDWHTRQVVVTEMLLSRGADLYSKYPDGSFVLQRIVEDRGLFGACFPFLQAKDINMKGAGGRTLLMQACKPSTRITWVSRNQRDPECQPVPVVMSDAIQLLLRLGPDVGLKDDQGRTALHWFCTYASPLDALGRDMLKALIAADPSTLNATDNDGRLPIHLALEAFSSRHDSLDFTIRELIAAGVDISIPDPVNGDSALHHISRSLSGHKKEEVTEAKVLFQDLAKILDIGARNNLGESVTAAALGARFPGKRLRAQEYPVGVQFAYCKILHFLQATGAPLDTIDAKGRNLLHVAAGRPINAPNSWHNQEREMVTELFKVLLDLGIDPRKEDDELRTPVDIAVARDLSEVVDLFSEEGKRAAEARKLKASVSSDIETGSAKFSDDDDGCVESWDV